MARQTVNKIGSEKTQQRDTTTTTKKITVSQVVIKQGEQDITCHSH